MKIYIDGCYQGEVKKFDRMELAIMNIVRRSGLNRYWLDEKRAADGKGVLKQRLILIAIAVVLGVTIGVLARMGILPL